MSKKHKEPVILYVYDLSDQNEFAFRFGLGAYHSGVVVHGSEYTFGQGGVMTHAPGGAASDGQCTFRQKVKLGETTKTPNEISKIYDELSNYFKGKDYNTLQKNCNHFSDEFSKRVLDSKKSVMPSWVNRTANIGNKMSSIFGTGKKTETEKLPEVNQGFKAFKGKGQSLSGTVVKDEEKKKGSGWKFWKKDNSGGGDKKKKRKNKKEKRE